MSKKSALEEMGVNNPDQITKYSLRQVGNEDILKIYYKRQKGSFLPASRKYVFGRSIKMMPSGNDKQQYVDTFEISPVLNRAIDELNKIVQQQHDAIVNKQIIIDEIEHLEKIMENKLQELRQKVEDL